MKDGYLLDHAGDGFTALLFGPVDGWPAVEAALRQIDRRFVALHIGSGQGIADDDGKIASVFSAQPGSVYLLRPDHHVAGRWTSLQPDEIITTVQRGFGRGVE